MVRISIPTLPPSPPVPPNQLTLLPLKLAAAHLSEFLSQGQGKTVVLTGAGVSVDSGIRAYRGKDGHYSNPNYKPILYHELVEDTPRGELFRKRYWARSFLGYPPVKKAKPNPTHIYVAALQALGLASNLITQNVDNLHPKAINLINQHLPSSSRIDIENRVLELHGTLAKVHCIKHRHTQHRDSYQEQLAHMNPIWDQEAQEAERTGKRPRTNPDGDVDLPGADFTSFVVPPCRICAQEEDDKKSIVKPNVVFFGETLSPGNRDRSLSLVENASNLLVLGTSLATYSAFRLVKQAHEAGKRILMISTGPSRADKLGEGKEVEGEPKIEGIEKMDRRAGDVLRVYLDEAIKSNSGPEVEAVRKVLDMGVVVPPPEVEGPRAEG